MKFQLRPALVLLAGVLLVTACATEKAPSGGPEDKTAPQLLQSYPQSGAVRVGEKEEIILSFSEALDQTITERAFRVFPVNSVDIQVHVRNDQLLIRPRTSWPNDNVISIISNSNIKDRHNNSLKTALQISFTRQDSIPQNSLRGQVHDLEKLDIPYVAITRFHTHPDSILKYPEYIKQCDDSGNFEFTFLSPDTFYIAAFLDWDKSNTYKASADGIAIPVKNNPVADTIKNFINILAIHSKNEAPRLLSAESLTPGETELLFSKTPSHSNGSGQFIFNGHSADTVLIDDNTISCYHSAAPDSIRLSISGFTDNADYLMADTVFTYDVETFEDSAYSIEQLDNYLSIFPDPDKDSLFAEFISGTDTSTFILKKHYSSFYRLPVISGKRATCTIQPGISSQYPQLDTDSLYSVNLTFPGKAEYGSVNGKISFLEPYVVLVLKNSRNTYFITPSAVNFLFPFVLPGDYTLGFFIDKNQNGKADPGKWFPHVSPEIIYTLENTINIRARWDTELDTPYSLNLENLQKESYINRQLPR